MSPLPSKSLIWSHEPITSPPEMPAIGNFHQLPDATRRRPVADRGSHRLAADNTLQTDGFHQASDGAAGNFLAFTSQLPPNLSHAIDLEVFLEHARDLWHQAGITLRPCRQPRRIGPSGGMGAIGRWGDRQHSADRLDPVRPPG